jgi:hypothetical protein
MAEANDNHSNCAHGVDDAFQRLIHVCDLKPAIARVEIIDSLWRDKLVVAYHIRGGTRKTRATRQATDDELRAKQSTGATLDHLYETTPPEGLTGRVHFQAWDTLFDLTICDGHLIVTPSCTLDYPWEAYSFTVANWSYVQELWPVERPVAAPSTASVAISTEQSPSRSSDPPPAVKVKRRAWIEAYLTEDRKTELANKYSTVGTAAAAIHKTMQVDPTVEPYRTARIIEPHLDGLFPRRRKPGK